MERHELLHLYPMWHTIRRKCAPPESCTICTDERQSVNPHGQQWTTHEWLKRWYRNTVHQQGPGVIGVGVDPQVGIGQRALLIRGKEGNVLWDCVSLLDDGVAELPST